MSKSRILLLNVYLYLVLAISLGFSVMHLGFAAWGLVQTKFPQITIRSWEYERLTNFNRYKREFIKRESRDSKKGKKTVSSDEEIKQMQLEEQESALRVEKRTGKRTLLASFLWLLILLPVFLLHLRTAIKNYRS